MANKENEDYYFDTATEKLIELIKLKNGDATIIDDAKVNAISEECVTNIVCATLQVISRKLEEIPWENIFKKYGD